MKLCVLEAQPLLGDDLAPAPLLALADDVLLFDQTAPADVLARLDGARVAVTNKVRLGAEQFSALPQLGCVSVLATGYDAIDVAAARAHGVVVCNVRGYSTPSTAQHALALLLELTNQVGEHARQVAAGEWARRGIWSYSATPLFELDGKTVLIIGMGAIGSRMARFCEALGMRVLAGSARRKDELFALLPQADVVSLHCPLSDNSRALVNEAFLSSLKPGALLVNVARGPIVVEEAIVAALKSGQLGGYGADVTATEPPPTDSSLLSAPNCLLTPHNAWASGASRARLLDETIANIRAYLAREPRNVVS
ncbi:MAG: NAD(P)-dependent oxidoreductase [Armatimonas sp.]